MRILYDDAHVFWICNYCGNKWRSFRVAGEHIGLSRCPKCGMKSMFVEINICLNLK